MFVRAATLLMMSTALGAGGAMAQTITAPTSPATPAAPAPMSTPAPTPSTMAPTPGTAGATAVPATAGKFVTEQGMGEFRASKFIGVDIYGAEMQKIGDINEILIDANGSAKTVVIGVGGFLGIGQKNVAVPFSSIEWKLEPIRAAVATPAAPAMGTTASPTTTMAGVPATTASTMPARSPAETAAYNGYPDHGAVKMTKAELQDAPSFKYYADMHSGSGAPSNAVVPPATPARQ